METETATVLLLDTTDTVAADIRAAYREMPAIEILHEDTLDSARGRLSGTAVDSVVVHLDPLDDADRHAFVSDVQAAAPDCSLILLTADSRDGVADDLLSAKTAVVEHNGDEAGWEFLAEKIRSSLQSTPVTGRDQEMYRTLVESARDGLYRLDANGNLVYANESWAEILGYDREEMLGMHASQAMAEGELERGQKLIQQVLNDDDRESDIVDLEMVRKDGTQITVAVHFVVLTTEEGVYDGVMGVARDVTERRADKRVLERTNERLDEFASVVSHDLRNPLNVAQSRVELLENAEGHETDEHVEAIERSLSRMEGLIDDLLTVARDGDQTRETEQVELRAVTEQCWQTIATKEATLRVETDRTVTADRSRLRQLVANLLRNAVDHGDNEVMITVGTLSNGFYVEDDGPGISPADRDRVFESGYSTAGTGTGYGLSIVADVADAHDWEGAATEGATGGARVELTDVQFVD